MSDVLAAAVFDPDVIASVLEATVLERYEQPLDDPFRDPHVSNVCLVRDPEPADYVAAVHEHIDKFDGLETHDVDEAAVAAVLPQEEIA